MGRGIGENRHNCWSCLNDPALLPGCLASTPSPGVAGAPPRWVEVGARGLGDRLLGRRPTSAEAGVEKGAERYLTEPERCYRRQRGG